MNRVLISGGSRGIGAVPVRAFAQNGDAAECFIAHSGTTTTCLISPPSAAVLMEGGMLWAADGKDYVAEHGLDVEKYDNTTKIY